MSGPGKCPTCGGRLEGVELQRLRTQGMHPGRQRSSTSPFARTAARLFPFTALTANGMASRAPTVYQRVRVLLAARD